MWNFLLWCSLILNARRTYYLMILISEPYYFSFTLLLVDRVGDYGNELLCCSLICTLPVDHTHCQSITHCHLRIYGIVISCLFGLLSKSDPACHMYTCRMSYITIIITAGCHSAIFEKVQIQYFDLPICRLHEYQYLNITVL